MSGALGPVAGETRVARGVAYGLRVAGPRPDAPVGAATEGREEAPFVLLLHGFAGSGADWDPVTEALAGAGFRVAAVDLPGHGRTAAATLGRRAAEFEPGRFAPQEVALDLIALLEQLEVERAHWVGYSMGGRLALLAALDHPNRVESLVVESASPGIADERERADRVRADEALAESIRERGIAWFAESWGALPIFASQRSLPAETRAALDARRRRNDPAGLALSLRTLGQGAQPYVGSRLERLDLPVLLVTGELDTKYVELAAAMAPRFPSALHLVVPDAGHNVHLERPEWFVRSLLVHLRRSAGRSAHASPATS